MTEIKKSSEVYGGSLGLQTTVNMGFRLLKPEYILLASFRLTIGLFSLTSDRKLWATGDELQEVPPLGWGELAHCLQKIADALAVHIETVVCLDRIE